MEDNDVEMLDKEPDPPRRKSKRISIKIEAGEIPDEFNINKMRRRKEKDLITQKWVEEQERRERLKKRADKRRKNLEVRQEKQRKLAREERLKKKKKEKATRKRKRSTTNTKTSEKKGTRKKKFRKTKKKGSVAKRRKTLKSTQIFHPTEKDLENCDKFEEVFEADNSYDISRGSIYCSRQAMRAVEDDNMDLLKKVFEDYENVHNPFIQEHMDTNENVLSISIKTNNLEAVKYIADFVLKCTQDEKMKEQETKRVTIKSNLGAASTGSNSRFTLGFQTRRIQQSRGGKEGNNAFTKDSMMYTNGIPRWFSNNMHNSVLEAIKTHEISKEMIDCLINSFPNEKYWLGTAGFYAVCLSGNVEVAGHMVKIFTSYGGYGFNFLHNEALTFSDENNLTKYRSTSVTKKSAHESHQITPVHCAAINSSTTKFLRELTAGSSIHVVDKRKRKPIHFAAACENVENLRFLIDKGADIAEADIEKKTPLHIACMYGREENVELILQQEGAEVFNNVKCKKKFTPMITAVIHGHLECVKKLVEVGEVKIDTPGDAGQTPLHYAARFGHLDICEYLISKGHTIRKIDKLKRSSLHLAAMNHHVESGLNPEHKDSSENSVCHYCAGFGFFEGLRLLKSLGIPFNVYNMWKASPLLISLLKNNKKCSMFLLQQKDLDLNAKNQEGQTVLMQLLENKDESNISFVEYMLNSEGIDVNVQDNQGVTLFHLVAKNRNDKIDLRIAQMLKAKNAPMDLKDKNGKTPLNIAVGEYNVAPKATNNFGFYQQNQKKNDDVDPNLDMNLSIIKFLLQSKVEITNIADEKKRNNVFHVLFKKINRKNLGVMKEIMEHLVQNYDKIVVKKLLTDVNSQGDFPLFLMTSKFKIDEPPKDQAPEQQNTQQNTWGGGQQMGGGGGSSGSDYSDEDEMDEDD